MTANSSEARPRAVLSFVIVVAMIVGSLVTVAQARPSTQLQGHARPTASHSPGDHGRGGGRRDKTRIRLRLSSHRFESGEDVDGTVTLKVREGNKWEPLEDEDVVVYVDRAEVDTVTTASDGTAAVEADGLADGGHVMRVKYAGDDDRRPARHSQGFNLGNPDDDDDDDNGDDD